MQTVYGLIPVGQRMWESVDSCSNPAAIMRVTPRPKQAIEQVLQHTMQYNIKSTLLARENSIIITNSK